MLIRKFPALGALGRFLLVWKLHVFFFMWLVGRVRVRRVPFVRVADGWSPPDDTHASLSTGMYLAQKRKGLSGMGEGPETFA